jgi:Zn-dependent protease
MIPKRLSVGSVYRVPIEVDRSWFVLLVAATVFLGIVGSALFFLSLVLHELGHSLVAIRCGLRVKSIRFFMFGGLTEMEKNAASPAQELGIALAGPLVSGLIGAVFLLSSDIVPGDWGAIAGDMERAGTINLLLAAFNLVPAFPLDGGRALRAILWKVSGSYARGTQQAITCTRFAIYGAVAAGAAYALIYSLLVGSLVVLVAWRMKKLLPDDSPEPHVDSPKFQPVM